MQKFILIRGHQGSGKSTFAQAKIDEFITEFPNAKVFHIENDLLLTDDAGNYHWSPKAVEKAIKRGQKMMKNALKTGKANPHQHILVINSNTNQKSGGCISLLTSARKHGFDTEIYRLHNFYDNTHNVKQADVINAYLRLNNNRLRDEIHLKPSKPMSDEIKQMIDEIMTFKNKPLPFDDKQNTYVTAEYVRYGELHNTVIIKHSEKYPELRVLKYHQQVFYNNCFDNALLEMRGLVIDQYNNIIVRPFKKAFNYSERIGENSLYPISIDDNHIVDVVVKVNGFLGVCTYVDLPNTHPSFNANFNKQVLYSTTGTLDSKFAKMNQAHCQKYTALFKEYPNHTFLFEITDETDVHIIEEEFGETLIGMVDITTGRQFGEDELDQIASNFYQTHGITIKRPEQIKGISFGELKALLKEVKHEGFMVFDSHSKEMLFKLKSPYYLVSKFLGRSNDKNISKKLDKHKVDEEYYPLVEYIEANLDKFNQLSELDKIAFIQDFLENI